MDESKSNSNSNAPPSANAVPQHVSGLWIGQAVPDASLADVPVNPIRWSATLTRPDVFPGAPSFFGAGYFDDAADVENSPVLFYTLRGVWDPEQGTVEFDKVYETEKISSDFAIKYEGRVDLATPDGQPTVTGSWTNAVMGTFGTFAARLEEA